MLAVHLEVFPAGDITRRRTVSGVAIANISALAAHSDYHAVVIEDGTVTQAAHVVAHRRDDGAVALLRRVLEEATDDLDVVPARMREALLQRMHDSRPVAAESQRS